jgi:hypothetical protein
MGQWFIVNTAMVALVIWCWSPRPWAAWPWPMQDMVLAWCVASPIVFVLVVMNSVFTFIYEWWKGPAQPIPVAPKPAAPATPP